MAFSGPLAGIRVLEVGGFSAAFAGKLLADAGAEVTRLVLPAGDRLESEPPFLGATRISIQSAWYHLGKRLLALDQAEPAARLRDAVVDADILLEDATWPGRSSPDDLRQVNPRLVQVSISPFGLGGPRQSWRANDLVANAMSGAASVTGSAGSGPISGYGNQAHHTAGLYAAVCALAALRAARTSGTYQLIDLSEHEALISCTEQVLMQWFFPDGTWGNPIAPRQGSKHWSGAYEVYPGRDGHGVMVTAALQFADVLLPWLVEDGAAEDLDDPEKYPNLFALIRDLPHVMEVLRKWVATYDGEALFYEGQRRHQPFGVVWNIEEAATRSPQLAARSYFQPIEVPGAGPVQFPGRLFRTSADGPCPGLAQDVDDVSWARRETPLAGPRVASSRPLEGIRVLDFTHVLAGPFGTRVLGDLGADIIKVGTTARSGGANSPDHPYYTMWNRNKRSVTINMASAEGRAFARRLALKCDVIIENFSAGVLKRWGLDRAGLHAEHPGATVIHMGGVGQDGPWRDFVTFAPTIHALTGLTYLTNPPGEHLLGYGFSLTDHLSGLAGALAALEGIANRERTGEGIEVDLSQYELGMGLMGPALLDYFANSVNPEPVGNRHPFGAWLPHGIYPTRGDDRWIAIAVRDDQWDQFARLPGLELVDDPRFSTHELRLTNQDALDDAIRAWTSLRDSGELAELCQKAGIAAGPVQNARDLLESDPQLAARRFFGTAVGSSLGEHGIDQFPALFNGERPSVYDGVHAIGQDTFDVATGVIGLSDEEVADLVGNGALN